MACDLDIEELQSLCFLYNATSLFPRLAMPEDEFRKWYNSKIEKKKFRKNYGNVIGLLIEQKYITKVGQHPTKYMIGKSNWTKAFDALDSHKGLHRCKKISTGKKRPHT